MTPYIATFILLSLLSFTQHTKQLKKFKLLFFLYASLFLILFTGLRQLGVGADDINYYNAFMFKAPNFYNWIFGEFTYRIEDTFMEPGYLLINSLIRIFTKEYIFLFLTIGFLSVGIASYNYQKHSRYVFLTLLLFFVHTYLYRDMNQIRSAVAAAISLFLIAQIHNKEHIKIWITLFFASIFHFASLPLVFVYILSAIKVTRKRVLIAYILFFIMGAIGVSQIAISVVPGGGFLARKLHNYTANASYANAVSFFDITNVKNSFILILILIFWERLDKKVPYFTTLVLFYLLAVGIRLAFWDLGVLAARIATFFGIVEVILIPYFVSIFRQKLLVMTVIIFYAFVMLYLNLFIKSGRFPYELSIF